jgi:hypothetical protein
MIEDDVDISIASLQERSAKGDSLTVREDRELKEDLKAIEAAHSVIRSGKRGIFRLNKDQRFFVKHVLSTCLVNDSSQLDKLLQVYELSVNDALRIPIRFCERNCN